MGEIRIVGLGKARGYPYPVCKKISTAAVAVPCGGRKTSSRTSK